MAADPFRTAQPPFGKNSILAQPSQNTGVSECEGQRDARGRLMRGRRYLFASSSPTFGLRVRAVPVPRRRFSR